MHTPRHTSWLRPQHSSALALLVTCLAAPFAMAPAAAQTSTAPGMTTSPGYIGLSVGSSDFSKPGNGFGIFGNDQRATAYSITAGNYVFSPNWGLELGYTDFGSVNRAGGSTKADGINFSLIGRMPLNRSWNLLGKVGTTYGRTDVSSNPALGVTAGTERDFGLSYGLGAEVQLASQWSAVLQYEEHNMKFPGGSTDRVNATKLGLRYHY